MRYNKQVLLKDIGIKGQKLLSKSTIAIIGLGALGSNSSSLAARAGINLVLIDRDIIELDNLQRQNLFSEKDIGKSKSLQAKKLLQEINSEIKIEAYLEDLNYKNIDKLKDVDLILDCTDNLETRFLINEFCIKNKIPWIYSSVLGTRGCLLNIVPGSFCFNCVFREPDENLETCDTIGVLNTIANLISSMQFNEAIKMLTNKNHSKKLIYYDIWKQEIKKIRVNKNPNCKTCNGDLIYLTGKKGNKIIKMCGRSSYQITGKNINLDNLNIKNVKYKDQNNMITDDFIAFKDGRVIVKAQDEKRAKIIYSKYFG